MLIIIESSNSVNLAQILYPVLIGIKMDHKLPSEPAKEPSNFGILSKIVEPINTMDIMLGSAQLPGEIAYSLVGQEIEPSR